MSTPANYRLGQGQVYINGADVGDTNEEGVVITVTPSIKLLQSGKYGTTPMKAFFTGQEVTIEMTLAEHTPENLERAIAGSDLDSSILNLGGLAGREIAGAVVKLVPFDGTPIWTFKNAVPTSPVEVLYKTEDQRVVHVTFTGMVDTDEPDASNVAEVS